MRSLVDVILPVLIVATAAALAHSRLHLDFRALSRAVFYLFTPTLVFRSMATSRLSGAEMGQITAVFGLLTLALWLLAFLAARLLHLDGPTRAAFVNAILLINAGNYGLPVVLFAYGEAGLAPAAIFFTANAVVSASLGVYLSASGQAAAWAAVKRVVRVPIAYGALLGLLFNLAGWSLPGPLDKAVELLSQASVPVMLTVLGVQLVETVRGEKRTLRPVALGTVLLARLAISPALTWGLACLVGLGGLARDVTILESAMPTAVMSIILAAEFESDSSFAALSVLATTLASVVSVTLILNLLA